MNPIPKHTFNNNDLEIEVQYINNQTYNVIQEAHRHDYYEFFVFKSAKGIHDIDFKSYPIDNNCIHCITEHQVHHITRERDAEGYVVAFHKEFYYLISQSENLYDFSFFHTTNNPTLNGLNPKTIDSFIVIIKEMDTLIRSNLTFNKNIVWHYLSILLYKLRQLFPCPNYTLETKISKNFLEALEEHFISKRQVQDYAQLLNLTPRQLNDALQKDMNTSTSHLIHNRVVLEAKRLLYYNKMSIKEIAYFLGFEDPAHFTKYIKNKTGYTPQEIKTQIEHKYH